MNEMPPVDETGKKELLLFLSKIQRDFWDSYEGKRPVLYCSCEYKIELLKKFDLLIRKFDLHPSMIGGITIIGVESLTGNEYMLGSDQELRVAYPQIDKFQQLQQAFSTLKALFREKR